MTVSFDQCYFCPVDVYSYDEDDMVEDPNLAQHLAHFGINIAQMEKVWWIPSETKLFVIVKLDHTCM